jgi:hypothetical protein
MAGELLLINPRKRRGKRRKARGRKRNPLSFSYRTKRKARSHRRRRNPSMRLIPRGGQIMTQLVGAAQGAGGAILTDAAWTMIPLPLMLKAGPMGLVSRALMAFAVSWASSFMVGQRVAGKFLEGALAVQAYGVIAPMVRGFLPGGMAGNDIEGLGFYSPGMILQDDLSPLPDLNAGTPLQAYISGLSENGEGGTWDDSIQAYIS